MLERTLQLKPETKLEVAKKQEQQKKLVLLEKFYPKVKDGSVFRYDKETGAIEKAKFEEFETYKIGVSNETQLVIVPNSIYVEALNVKNAKRRVLKQKVILVT